MVIVILAISLNGNIRHSLTEQPIVHTGPSNTDGGSVPKKMFEVVSNVNTFIMQLFSLHWFGGKSSCEVVSGIRYIHYLWFL